MNQQKPFALTYFCLVNINQIKQSVKHTINSGKSIRLRDLIFWILNINFTYFISNPTLLVFIQGNYRFYSQNCWKKCNCQKQMELNIIILILIEFGSIQLKTVNIKFSSINFQIILVVNKLIEIIQFILLDMTDPFMKKQMIQTSQKHQSKLKKLQNLLSLYVLIKLFSTNQQEYKKFLLLRVIVANSKFMLTKLNYPQIIQIIQKNLCAFHYQENINNYCFLCLNIDDNINDYRQSPRYKIIPKINKDLEKLLNLEMHLISCNQIYIVILYSNIWLIPNLVKEKIKIPSNIKQLMIQLIQEHFQAFILYFQKSIVHMILLSLSQNLSISHCLLFNFLQYLYKQNNSKIIFVN
ncbi:unnamed protein product [Paramecium pentaurelia]|uniref:Transmembrane protein n=1 Tax=Paramecium pentaurelia TaxID=43138 RepID=A0A8S1SSC3_9CILI|nr:unnamed protein product [Paramecium pentaurelia]